MNAGNRAHRQRAHAHADADVIACVFAHGSTLRRARGCCPGRRMRWTAIAMGCV